MWHTTLDQSSQEPRSRVDDASLKSSQIRLQSQRPHFQRPLSRTERERERYEAPGNARRLRAAACFVLESSKSKSRELPQESPIQSATRIYSQKRRTRARLAGWRESAARRGGSCRRRLRVGKRYASACRGRRSGAPLSRGGPRGEASWQPWRDDAPATPQAPGPTSSAPG